MPDFLPENSGLPLLLLVGAIGVGFAIWKKGNLKNLGEVIQNLRSNDLLRPALAIASQHPMLLSLVKSATSLSDLRVVAKLLKELIECLEKQQPTPQLPVAPQPEPTPPVDPK
jgi:hypothetical protein